MFIIQHQHPTHTLQKQRMSRNENESGLNIYAPAKYSLKGVPACPPSTFYKQAVIQQKLIVIRYASLSCLRVTFPAQAQPGPESHREINNTYVTLR